MDEINKDYEKQLIETIERQEKELIKCRKLLDDITGINDNVKNSCTRMSFSEESINDLQNLHYSVGLDMLEYVCDGIKRRGMEILEEEIENFRKKYGD